MNCKEINYDKNIEYNNKIKEVIQSNKWKFC